LTPRTGGADFRGYDETVENRPAYEPFEPPERPDSEPSQYGPIRPENRLRDLGRKLWAPLAAVGLVLLKFKGALLVVFKLKIFATSATMLVAAYALFWGWTFALGFVLLLLVHELGHVFELRRQGVPATAPLFIPFLGAVVGMKQMPKDAWREAQVALAGPILGSLGAAATWGLGEALDSELLIALAYVGFLLNLFNLLPVVPLDGGRAIAAIHPAFWAVGLAALVVLTIAAPNPIMLIVLVLGGLELWRRWKERGNPDAAAYYKVLPWQRAVVGVTYVGLAALLALGMSATFVERSL
jgi:Zn-dependent protease